MAPPLSDRALAAAVGIGGIGMLAASAVVTPHRVAGPLGVEAGFTVVLLAYLFARHEYGFRNALIAMMPAFGAQLTVLLRHDATFSWLGAELAILAALEVGWLTLRAVLDAPTPAKAPMVRARPELPAVRGRASVQPA